MPKVNRNFYHSQRIPEIFIISYLFYNLIIKNYLYFACLVFLITIITIFNSLKIVNYLLICCLLDLSVDQVLNISLLDLHVLYLFVIGTYVSIYRSGIVLVSCMGIPFFLIFATAYF